ncbi:MAG: TRAP transporter small permease [Rhizobiaceae bacterium]|nr:TRAP transporter small permease [Rhizobiaceae bacterium]
MHPYRTIERLLDTVARWSVRVSSLALYVITAMIAYEIVLRNLFNTSSGFSTEYSAYLLVFLVFFALPETQRTGAMIYMEFVYDRLPPRIGRAANIFRYMLSLAYAAAITYYVFDFTSSTCSLGQKSLYATQTPLCVPQSVMVVGLALFTVELLRGTINAFRHMPAEEAKSDEGSAI